MRNLLGAPHFHPSPGHRLVESYLDNPEMRAAAATNPCLGPEFGSTVVPEDVVWVMGDNRTTSADSRYHQGDQYSCAVPVDNIIGKVRAIILPPAAGAWSPHRDPTRIGADQGTFDGRIVFPPCTSTSVTRSVWG